MGDRIIVAPYLHLVLRRLQNAVLGAHSSYIPMARYRCVFIRYADFTKRILAGVDAQAKGGKKKKGFGEKKNRRSMRFAGGN